MNIDIEFAKKVVDIMNHGYQIIEQRIGENEIADILEERARILDEMIREEEKKLRGNDIYTLFCNNCKEEFGHYTNWNNCINCGADICEDCTLDYKHKCPECGHSLN